MFTYTDEEIEALTPLSVPRFNFMFKYLHALRMINETNAAEHIDKFRERMEFLVHLLKFSTGLWLTALLASFCRTDDFTISFDPCQTVQHHPPGHGAFPTCYIPSQGQITRCQLVVWKPVTG
jgi:hypothetical protein